MLDTRAMTHVRPLTTRGFALAGEVREFWWHTVDNGRSTSTNIQVALRVYKREGAEMVWETMYSANCVGGRPPWKPPCFWWQQALGTIADRMVRDSTLLEQLARQ
jgi:hypothetical protein